MSPRSLSEILAEAALHRGGEAAALNRLPQPRPAAELARIPDDRWLAALTKQVFRAGFVWRIVDAKWPGFEEAFYGFDPGILSVLPDEEYEAMATDERIIRNWQKIATVMENADMVEAVAADHGSFAAWVAAWPADRIVDLWAELRRRGARLGGNTGPFALRAMGKDTFLLTRDVNRALIREGIVDRRPTGKRQLARVQAAFNDWTAESGRPLCQVSAILARSVGP